MKAMQTGYYFKLTIFLILAVGGGLVGTAAGAIAGYGISMLVVMLFGGLTRDMDPMAVGFLTIVVVMTASFCWSFLKSYTYLVRNFW
jgi:uncharacterized membrane protein YfcA